MSTSEATVKIGNTLRLRSQTVPYNSTDYIRWESADPSVAEVWPNGKVVPLTEGTVAISAIASSGEQAVCTVTVVP